MKHIYIICLLMSSFFTYKNCFATDELIKYAFFLPKNIFQENTTVEDISNMKPRYEKTDNDNTNNPKQQNETLSKNSGLVNKIEKPKITSPYVKKKIEIDKNTIAQKEKKIKEQPKKEPLVAPKPPAINKDIKEKLNQFILNDRFNENDSINNTISINKEDILKKEIAQRLATIPYTNRSLPEFKQRYTDYGADLRILFRLGKFPTNQQQDNVLEKANSSRRFEVK